MNFSLPLPNSRRHNSQPAANQEQIALDPTLVEQVETVLPLDIGAGTVAAIAVSQYGVERFKKHGLSTQEAREKARQIASVLPDLGYKAGIAAEQRDYLEADQFNLPLEVAEKDLQAGQKAETVPAYTRPTVVKSGKTEIVRVFEPTLDAAQNRVNKLEEEAPKGLEAQVTIEALVELANKERDTVDGSLAAGFVRKVKPDQPHIRLG